MAARLGRDLLVGKMRDVRTITRMLDGDAAKVALAVEVKQRVLIKVFGLGNLNRAKLYVMGSGQRADLLVQAGLPGTYYLVALKPGASPGWSAVSGSGIDPAPRQARISFDTPPPFPTTLATVVVSVTPLAMRLPTRPLPLTSIKIPSCSRI